MLDKCIEALREAIQEIAETMLFVEILPVEATKTRSTHSADVSAVIGYSSALKGSMRLAGPEPSVRKLAGALLGEERDMMDKEMEDAFSEMANMIAGGVQTRLEGLGLFNGHIRMSPPVIISGQNHQVSSDRSFRCASHTFEMEGESFFAEIYYSEDSMNANNDDDDEETKYGFSLSIPMPASATPKADSSAHTEDGLADDEATAEIKEVKVEVEEEALREALKKVCQEKIERMAQNTTSDMVREMLPELAEKMVREEIERIKNAGL